VYSPPATMDGRDPPTFYSVFLDRAVADAICLLLHAENSLARGAVASEPIGEAKRDLSTYHRRWPELALNRQAGIVDDWLPPANGNRGRCHHARGRIARAECPDLIGGVLYRPTLW
jgi:hypothetical protein